MTLHTVEPSDWDRIVHTGARAIAERHMEPNNGTPEEFAGWALQAMLPEITRLLVNRLTEARDEAKTFHDRAALNRATALVMDILWDRKITPDGPITAAEGRPR